MLPFQKLRSETVEHEAQDLAALLSWDEAKAGWGLVKLERWGLSRCTDDAPPSAQAVVRGPSAMKLVARAFGWRKDPALLLEACEQLPSPHARRVPDGVELCRLKDYDDTWTKAKKERDRKAKAREEEEAKKAQGQSADTPRTSGGSPADGEGKKEMKIETKKEAKEETQSPEQEPLALEGQEPPESAKHPLQALWAELADPSLSRWRKLDPTRRKKADAAWREHGPGGWRDIITRVNATPFLLGETGDWSGADLDWLLEPRNLNKVLEGKYAARARPSADRPRHGDGTGARPEWPCAICGDTDAALLAEGIYACYPHLAEFRADTAKAERPWELAEGWVAQRRAEVAA
jgi:hypothetical protein